VRGQIEAVELPDLLDLGRIQPLAAVDAGCRPGRRALAPDIAPLQLRHHLLHRPARDELDNDEGEQQNPEQGRDHEQQALEDVAPHISAPSRHVARAALAAWRCCSSARLAALAHQVASTQPSGWK